MYLAAVADDRTCTWLKMAGVSETFSVSNPKDGFEPLKSLMKRIDVAIIIITPDVARANTKLVQESLGKKDVFPIVLELPLTAESGTELQSLISSALGVEFKV
jgi:vacuolar-type H+-ATPase subunit F/Vma7